jgi:hypothetical protein
MVVRSSYDQRGYGRRGRLPRAVEPPGPPLGLQPGSQPERGREPVAEPVGEPVGAVERRRVRDEALDGVYVMAFSLLASTATACVLVLLTRLAG